MVGELGKGRGRGRGYHLDVRGATHPIPAMTAGRGQGRGLRRGRSSTSVLKVSYKMPMAAIQVYIISI